ncbi:uncharacterized protein GGS25DRAFT_35794 [Hypoxylon fragiforme]|uniref:uncharacterized protein n=1 Tax=Hypoxylon fragiforme TaxID=63214 RepID=UPI0020C741E0|nr:uncharacterized protein GGS25DRAFT_35794 [Hypoxylon fragiforme]KAI2614135.1 hypothetical protein GGS25DRAFT_35794 [Hypoxylon fragiforme]
MTINLITLSMGIVQTASFPWPFLRHSRFGSGLGVARSPYPIVSRNLEVYDQPEFRQNGTFYDDVGVGGSVTLSSFQRPGHLCAAALVFRPGVGNAVRFPPCGHGPFTS